jgi:8-amino-7-oxononanoate synthase
MSYEDLWQKSAPKINRISINAGKLVLTTGVELMNWLKSLQTELDELRSREQFRQLRDISTFTGLNLSGNDYLGIGENLVWREEFYQQLSLPENQHHSRLSASSSRLLTGNHQGYRELEDKLSQWYNGCAALVFNSGYHANLGILPALADTGDIILSDKLNHASIIDGIRLSGAEFHRYPHLNYERLEQLLKKHADGNKRIFIVTESVFSMDGDIADLQILAALKNRYNAILIVDEAHAVGVFGKTGAGIAESENLIDQVDIIIGTFGKALCSSGAYAIMHPTVREYLINKMRPLIFTTALPPIITCWSSFIVDKVREMNAERLFLQSIAREFRSALTNAGGKTGGNSQIVPLLIGDNAATVQLSEHLRSAGYLVFPVRPPTVPPGTARLRFSLSAKMSGEQLCPLAELIKNYTQ